jgi:hypothetical protein
MSTLREAAQQALEALEQCGLDDTHRSYEFEHVARIALRAALAQEEQAEPVDPSHNLEEAAAELRRLHADAERYRYLRNRNPQEILPVIGNAAGVWIDCDDENGVLTLLTGEDADAAIDAAMGKT